MTRFSWSYPTSRIVRARDLGIVATFCCWARKCWCAIKKWETVFMLITISASLTFPLSLLFSKRRSQGSSTCALTKSSLLFSLAFLSGYHHFYEGREGRRERVIPPRQNTWRARCVDSFANTEHPRNTTTPWRFLVPLRDGWFPIVMIPGLSWATVLEITATWLSVWYHSKIRHFQSFFVAFSSIIEQSPPRGLSLSPRSRIARLVHFLSTKTFTSEPLISRRIGHRYLNTPSAIVGIP